MNPNCTLDGYCMRNIPGGYHIGYWKNGKKHGLGFTNTTEYIYGEYQNDEIIVGRIFPGQSPWIW